MAVTSTLVIRAEQAMDAAADLDRSVDLLRAVADGAIGEDRVVRLYAPLPTVALSRRESRMPGFDVAAQAAIERGFTPVVRPTGGRAVAYDSSCIVFDIVQREREMTDQRTFFIRVGESLVSAMRRLGADARLGDVPGEYCPGEFSVNARGAVKLIGTSQRAVRGARLLSGMVPLNEVAHLADVLAVVNAALGLDWDAATFGTLRDEAPPVDRSVVEDAIVGALIEV
ncbi:lipoate--protein ligase family protein [Microbacterium protaetiae]|uniref:Lipoate--protein ligase family protein n=1 Tax=Microbacterium protaetiae TaxID=2509458 RepID=A0A4P6EC45_9MICO|nr:lipoate--protein ligase family protein [Microbacterium protaetiae]QAY58559.1 lipoate--protein ligase family protein [Microbacterium protaetiae]